MKKQTLPLKRIGRSQAVCLPAAVIRRYHFKTELILEDRGHEVVLRSVEPQPQLSWSETYREMAVANEDWADWNAVSSDGVGDANEWSHIPPPSLIKPRRARK